MSNVVSYEQAKAKNFLLENYDSACRQLKRTLDVSKNIGQVKEVLGIAEAMQAYAKLMSDKKAVAEAWEIREHARRTLGKMMEEGKADRAGVGRPPGRQENGFSENPFSLEELGISKTMAHRARQLAKLSEEDWGLYVMQGRADVSHPIENAPQLKAKPKLKPKQMDYECPHCGKPIYLRKGVIYGE